MYERLAPLQHDSLDGIPEPSEATRLFGHEAALAQLQSAHEQGKLHHALLLTGPRGIGKATLGFTFAAWLLGEHGVPRDPTSPIYRQIATGAHPGLLHLTRPFDEKAKKFKQVITADEIRKVGRFLSLRTHDGGYRVVIVDPADDMNRNAANALLKNLEEPPSKVLFILISHSPGRLLPTIRSRAQVIKVHPLADQAVIDVLGQFDHPLPASADEQAQMLARSAGSPRSALTLTLNGGLEIASATDTLVAARDLDIAGAYKLAEAVGGRDAGMQLAIFNAHVTDALAELASRFASAGALPEAEAAAREWSEASESIAETEAYNLDRKQHVMSMLQRLRRHRAA